MTERPFPETESPPDGSPCDYGNLYAERARVHAQHDALMAEYDALASDEAGEPQDRPALEQWDGYPALKEAQAALDAVNAHIAAIDARCARWTAGERSDVDVAAELERIHRNYVGICVRSRLGGTLGETEGQAQQACAVMWERDKADYEARIRNPEPPLGANGA